MRKRVVSLAALLAATALLVAALWVRRPNDTQKNYRTTSFFDVFETVCIVTGYTDTQEEWDAQMQALHADLQHYHRLFDIYHAYDGVTNLYQINAQAGQGPVAVDADLFGLLQLGQQVSALTGGACNLAGGALYALWHDARETATLPDPAALTDAMRHIDPAALVLDETAQTVALTDPAARLDVGSLGKGYATELAAQRAEARGLTSALLNIGGDLRAIGTKPDGSGWTVGIEDPRDPGKTKLTRTLGAGDSLVVSGDYQRYIEIDGVRYHHLIDPTTGQPARYHASVAVYCHGQNGLADGLSTGLFCLDEDAGREVLTQLDGVGVVWIDNDGRVVSSAGW